MNNQQGFIDLFWPGTLLVEQKSAGRSLEEARKQVFNDYLLGISTEQFPRYILLSDFQNFELLDLETGEQASFKLSYLHKNIHRFAFIVGYQTHKIKEQDPVNIKAAELMGKLHDQLRDIWLHRPRLGSVSGALVVLPVRRRPRHIPTPAVSRLRHSLV